MKIMRTRAIEYIAISIFSGVVCLIAGDAIATLAYDLNSDTLLIMQEQGLGLSNK